MTVEANLARYTCDRCKHSVVAADPPPRFTALDIRSGGRLSTVKHLCSECTSALDQFLFVGPRLEGVNELAEHILTTLEEYAANPDATGRDSIGELASKAAAKLRQISSTLHLA